MSQNLLVVSIVSHGHGDLVLRSLRSLADSLGQTAVWVRVYLTLNLPEPELEQSVCAGAWPFEMQLIHNPLPLGFGANHNQAFAKAQAAGGMQWFMVMNPDIFWPADQRAFWDGLRGNQFLPNAGLICPRQTDVQGHLQDYARRLMTPWGLGLRVLRRLLGLRPSGEVASVESADWVNGACMIWNSEAFAEIGGFDERYFMYCEDTDICLRLQLAGWRMTGAAVAVVHDARRNTAASLRHLRWHLGSIFRLWCSSAFWRFIVSKKVQSWGSH